MKKDVNMIEKMTGKEESCANIVNQAKTVAVIRQALPLAGSYGYKECPTPCFPNADFSDCILKMIA